LPTKYDVACFGGAVLAPYGGKFFLNRNHYYLYHALAEEGVRLALILSQVEQGDPEFYDSHGYPKYGYHIDHPKIDVYPIPRRNRRTWIWACFRLAPRARGAYVVMPTRKGLVSCQIFFRLSIPYAVYFAADWLEVGDVAPESGKHRIRTRIIEWAEQSCAVPAKFVLAHAMTTKRRLEDMGIENVTLARPMLDITQSDFYQRSNLFEADTIRALYIGSITKRKGIRYLIDALALMVNHGWQIVLTIVGTGPASYVQALKEHAQRLRVDSRIHWECYARSKGEILRFYRTHDVFVLPSLAEGFPRVLYEAFSQSIPVVAVRLNSIESMLGADAEKMVEFVPSKDAESLARAIVRLKQSPARRAELIASAHAWVQNRLRIRQAEQLAELFRSVGWTGR